MIHSVKGRQDGAYDFLSYYSNLCTLKDLAPSTAVKANIKDGYLDFNGDKLKLVEWDPVFASISINQNLHSITIKSYFDLNIDEPQMGANALHHAKIPAIRSKKLSLSLINSLKNCLHKTECLTKIELKGLCLREEDISTLVKGLTDNGTVEELSLEYCRIKDPGLEILCGGLKVAGNVSILNIGGCSITQVGADGLATLLKYQAMCRHNEAWKESLRYRRPNLDRMPGLRRITLNHNPLIGDEGVKLLAAVLKDDLWLKALDMQYCGLGNMSAGVFLEVLKCNSTMVVLDLRLNPLIDRDVLRSVTEQVLVNADGKEPDFQWLPVSPVKQSTTKAPTSSNRAIYRGPSRPLSANKRPIFRPAGRLRSHSAEPRHPSKISSRSNTPDTNRSMGSDLPSERRPTELDRRASTVRSVSPDVRQRNKFESTQIGADSDLEELELKPPDGYEDRVSHSTQTARLKAKPAKKDPNDHPNKIKGTTKVPSKKTKSKKLRSPHEMLIPEKDQVVDPLLKEFRSLHAPSVTEMTGLKLELMQLKSLLNEERKTRIQLEDNVAKLLYENKELRYDLAKAQDECRKSSELASLIKQDEEVLRNLEKSFSQFHVFLDVMRSKSADKSLSPPELDHKSQPSHQDRPNKTPPQKARIIPYSSMYNPGQKTGQRFREDPTIAAVNKQRVSRQRQRQSLPNCGNPLKSSLSASSGRPFRIKQPDRAKRGGPTGKSSSLQRNSDTFKPPLDPIEAAYMKAKETKTEADKLFALLKEAAQSTVVFERGKEFYSSSHFTSDVYSMRDDNMEGEEPLVKSPESYKFTQDEFQTDESTQQQHTRSPFVPRLVHVQPKREKISHGTKEPPICLNSQQNISQYKKGDSQSWFSSDNENEDDIPLERGPIPGSHDPPPAQTNSQYSAKPFPNSAESQLAPPLLFDQNEISTDDPNTVSEEVNSSSIPTEIAKSSKPFGDSRARSPSATLIALLETPSPGNVDLHQSSLEAIKDLENEY